ncbi:hypothetical protein B0H11DRAFT_2239075 [Mycena galericulata]|nr:hypothetical protein B0H11DRAFT_2239075 [Mycena galericulata]
MKFTIVFSTLLAAITAVSALAIPDVVARIDVANGEVVPVTTDKIVVDSEVRATRFVGFQFLLTYFFSSIIVSKRVLGLRFNPTPRFRTLLLPQGEYPSYFSENGEPEA